MTAIEWTDATWNPVRGCSHVSEGCRHCYAATMAARIVRMGRGKSTPYDGLVRVVGGEARWTGAVSFDAEKLAEPLKRRKPTRYFVNSMSDLFHDGFSDEQIAAVFGVMAATPQHTFQILTKRPRMMREWFEWIAREAQECNGGIGMTPAARCFVEAQRREPQPDHMDQTEPPRPKRKRGTKLTTRHGPVDRSMSASWPLPNVWLGVSVEDQDAADKRIPDLLATPAALRFVSAEPLLGPLDVAKYMWPVHWSWDSRYATPQEALAAGARAEKRRQALVSAHAAFLDWVIAGCESGRGARPCEVDWLRSLAVQCKAAGVPFFLKQAMLGDGITWSNGGTRKPGGIISLPYLDGVQWAQMPGGSP